MYTPQFRRVGLLLVSMALTALGCGHPDNVEVTHTRVVRRGDPASPGATHADRFSMQAPETGGGMQGERSIAEMIREQLEWQVPEGWTELTASGMRIASLRPGNHPDADCSLIILEGGGGGLEGNINRWRGQLGLAPATSAEIAVMPSMNLLAQPGVLVDLDGTYTGMGGPEQENWHMRGVILADEQFAMFLKMTAPADVAEAEREAFDAFCASIRQIDAPQGMATASPQGAPLSFQTPEGWSDLGPKSMRAVNLAVGESQCYVILLGGEAGGLLMNLNRWRGEVGLDPIEDADVADLDQVTLLGSEVPLLDVRGDYSGMGDGGGANYRVFGAALIRDSFSVFVKMIGPEAELETQRAAFLEFLSTLEEA
jgi:hypothetical protein